MKTEELSTAQIFLTGSIITKINEEIVKEYKSNNDEDIKKSIKYISSKLDETSKELSEETLKRTIEGINRLNELFLDE